MRNLLRLISHNPIGVYLAIVIVALCGAYSVLHISVDLFPNLAVPVVNIISHYPAAAPGDVHLMVTRPIESEMRTIPGVKRVATTSTQGISQVTVQFGWGTSLDTARQLVLAKLSRLAGILPRGVQPTLENIGSTLQRVAAYAIYGGTDPISLRNIVRYDLANRLMGVKGVSSVDIFGGDEPAFYVEIKPSQLQRLNLSVVDVLQTLQEHNISSVAGYIERSSREYLLRGDDRIKTIYDLGNIPLRAKRKDPVFLRDVARIFEGYMPRHYIAHADGLPAVSLVVKKQPGASAIEVVKRVDRAIASMRHLLPPGTVIKKYYDQSEIIKESKDEIVHDILIGGILAILVLYLFLASFRPTFVVAITIPLTLCATVAVMYWLGLSLNVITMTALALSIGMIVDDAIVVAENIYRHGQLDKGAMEAAIDGAVEIAGPDASGTFTTVAAFLPLLLITGLASIFVRPFGLTISIALLVSLVLSLTLVPTLLARGPLESSLQQSLGGVILKAIDKCLRGILKFSFRFKWIVVAVAFLTLCTAGLLSMLGKASLLPPIDEGAILIEYIMPPGSSLHESNRIGEKLDRIALADPDVSCVFRRTGSPEKGYQLEGVNRGEIMIKLRPKKERSRSSAQIMDSLKRAYLKFDGVLFLFHQPTQEKIDESFSGLPALFGVTVYGPDLNKLTSIARKVEGVLTKDPAIANVVNNTKVKSRQIVIRADNTRMARYGVSPLSLMDTLKAVRFGVQATTIVRQRQQIGVVLKLNTGSSVLVENLGHLLVPAKNGRLVPLKAISQINISSSPATITTINGSREITLLAEVEGNIPAVASRLKKKFKQLSIPSGYSIDITGQYKTLIQTAIEMLFAVGGAILFIYLIMAMQFRSWRQPLVILATIPLALVGGVLALYLSHGGINISVAMGAITLIGVAVNNAIVLIDYANREMWQGIGLQDALLNAASVRLRPILLTSFTTIFALIPTAIGTTVGSKIFQPFAVTVIGGMLTGTMATLVVIPTLASILSVRGMWTNREKQIVSS